MTPDFTNIEYLKCGNSKQRKAYKVLSKINVFGILKTYDPILVGTIPINIDVENSDLDIVCYAKGLKAFARFVVDHFGEIDEFAI